MSQGFTGEGKIRSPDGFNAVIRLTLAVRPEIRPQGKTGEWRQIVREIPIHSSGYKDSVIMGYSQQMLPVGWKWLVTQREPYCLHFDHSFLPVFV